MPQERPLSTGDIARLLHVTGVAVLRWIRAGKLTAYRIPGGRFRIARDEFRKFLADNKIPVTLDVPSPRRVLVVDDDASVRDAFEAALRARGYEVELASDGRGALRQIRLDRFDLIFLDILLPSVAGASVLKALKRRDPEAVVVLITGYPYHDETLAALEYGPAMLLRKPIKLSDINAVLEIVFKE
ncbi:MAG: response regulator [candidate division NC10 bacterium]|nr:response regulator [candidate division NC10 bacterium]